MSVLPDTPATLMARMAASLTGESESSWVRFFTIYQPVIRRFADYAGAKGDSEDVAQDVLVKLVSILREGRYRPEKGRFRSYLAAITRREVINRWHKAQARAADRIVSLDDADSPVEAVVPSETEAVLDAKWRLARHDAALEHVLTKTALAAKTKEIYRAYAVEGRPIDEVASVFGVPRNAVSQAKTRVERMVADYEEMLSD